MIYSIFGLILGMIVYKLIWCKGKEDLYILCKMDLSNDEIEVVYFTEDIDIIRDRLSILERTDSSQYFEYQIRTLSKPLN